MRLSSKELKAINWYALNYGLRPQLSTPPTIYFKDMDGIEQSKDLAGITLEYNAWKKEDTKARARDKKLSQTAVQTRRIV